MTSIINFFANSDDLDRSVLKPLSHIASGWELIWDQTANKYVEENGNYSKLINQLITELDEVEPPQNYHDNEDTLANYVVNKLRWNISKNKGRWTGADYESILTQGGFSDPDEKDLIKAAAGRIRSAMNFGRTHYDDMETGHQKMLATVMTVILYHRMNLI
jgi:hypothetical protein